MWGLEEDGRKKYHPPGVEWIKVPCHRPECQKVREMLPSVYRTKKKNSKSGKMFCSVKCKGLERSDEVAAAKRQDASVIAS